MYRERERERERERDLGQTQMMTREWAAKRRSYEWWNDGAGDCGHRIQLLLTLV